MSVTRYLSRFSIREHFHKSKGFVQKNICFPFKCILCYELPLSSQWVCLGEPKSPFYPLTLLPSHLLLHRGFGGRLYKLAKDQEAPGSSFFKTDDRRSLFRCEIQSSLIEINPRATELHTSPSRRRSRPVQHFNYSDRSNLILYYNFQSGPGDQETK